MSELKTFTFGLGRYTEDGYPCVVAVDGEGNPRLAYDEKFYLKSEADKVIARHKFKRCLAMAKMCQARYVVEDVRVNSHCASWDYTNSEEMKYWERWRKRWLELAEKFKT